MTEETIKIEIPLSLFEKYDVLELRPEKNEFNIKVSDTSKFETGGENYKYEPPEFDWTTIGEVKAVLMGTEVLIYLGNDKGFMLAIKVDTTDKKLVDYRYLKTDRKETV